MSNPIHKIELELYEGAYQVGTSWVMCEAWAEKLFGITEDVAELRWSLKPFPGALEVTLAERDEFLWPITVGEYVIGDCYRAAILKITDGHKAFWVGK